MCEFFHLLFCRVYSYINFFGCSLSEYIWSVSIIWIILLVEKCVYIRFMSTPGTYRRGFVEWLQNCWSVHVDKTVWCLNLWKSSGRIWIFPCVRNCSHRKKILFSQQIIKTLRGYSTIFHTNILSSIHPGILKGHVLTIYVITSKRHSVCTTCCQEGGFGWKSI